MVSSSSWVLLCILGLVALHCSAEMLEIRDDQVVQEWELCPGGDCSEWDASAATRYERFVEWIEENGGDSECDFVRVGENNYGCFAKRDIDEKEILTLTPKELIVFNTTAVRDGPFPHLVNVGDWAPKSLWPATGPSNHFNEMAAFILYQRLQGEKSFWKPYIDIFPSHFEGHSSTWTMEEIAELQNSPARNDFTMRLKTDKLLYDGFMEVVNAQPNNPFPPGYLTFDRWLWAVLCCRTRAWARDVSSTMLVPIADMLNDDQAANTAGWKAQDEKTGFWVCTAHKKYAKGEELHDSYGRKNNAQLLLNYGFIPEVNPSDEMRLTYNFNATGLIGRLASEEIARIDPNFNQVVLQTNVRPDRLLRLYRMGSMTKFSDMDKMDDLARGKAVSLENELRAYRSVMESMKNLLSQYATTMEEDEAMLQENLTHKLRLAVRLRLGEKKLLQNTMDVTKRLWEQILWENKMPGDIVAA